jgi:nitroreductase
MRADGQNADRTTGETEGSSLVDAAIGSRRSVRAFLPTPVPRSTIEAILEVASRAPSGANMQPWKVTVLTGPALLRFTARVTDAYLNDPAGQDYERRYYPSPLPEPYLGRRRKIGWDLYGLLGIEKGDKARMRLQHARNFRFFDAPVGMIFTIDRFLEIGSWLDFGMFLENIAIAARGRGLDTCPQAAFAHLHQAVRDALPIDPDETVVSGMALGHADPEAVENQLQTERLPVSGFARFLEA